jgi:predicted O-methyltransferase YrrM
MVAAMQLSAVTSYLTANIAAIPLLWILPLAAYLLTLIVAFEYARFVPRPILTRLLAVMLAGLAYMMANADVSWPVGIGIAFFTVEMFLACLYCHVEAYALRPSAARELTAFYLMFAAGGAIGSFLIGIASPLLFSSNYDVPISFFATALVALLVVWPENWSQRLLWSAGAAMLIYVLVLLHAAYRRDTMFAARNFYASLRVKQTYDEHQRWVRTLSNGTIQHGTQIFAPELRTTPTTYYAEDSGVGLALRYCCQGRARNIGIVGLGTGTIAAYGRSGDHMRFYEINPAVLPIAQHLFTYLRDSPAQISFAEGDARASLTKEAPQNFDVLVIDAFSGDAIPLHLLTTQALAIYRRHLAPGGILAFHISNQHVDLEPAIALLARAAGMQARTVQSYGNRERGAFNATWMLVTDNAAFLALPAIAGSSRPPEQRAGLRLWTDDYSSLLTLLR